MKSMFIIAASLLASFATAQTTGATYSVQDLGLVGGAPGTPYFMSGNGLIAGAAVTPNNQSHATVWFMGFKLDLTTPGLGGLNSFANAVNDKGQVVGAAENIAANSEDFCGFDAYGVAKSSTACLPFVFQNGVMTKAADARRAERRRQWDQQSQRGGGMGGDDQQGPGSRLRRVAVPARAVG